MKITHYDLFAGIGGFSYAIDQVFYDQEIKHIFAEWERFPSAVLKKHWPNGTFYGDIADLVADTSEQRRQQESTSSSSHEEADEGRTKKHNNQPTSYDKSLTIVTGGFPCQPFSQAGRRKGTNDDRYKWPEMFAVIKNVRPEWVIAENVRGLVTWNKGMVLETVCADLESEGYEVWPLIIPACAVGAPHRRDRVWIIANRKREGRTRESRQTKGQHRLCNRGGENKAQNSWSKDWREVAFATCHDGVDDGLPRRLDGATYRGKRTDWISSAQWRKESLKAYGNAIVPQVAVMIFKSIKPLLLHPH